MAMSDRRHPGRYSPRDVVVDAILGRRNASVRGASLRPPGIAGRLAGRVSGSGPGSGVSSVRSTEPRTWRARAMTNGSRPARGRERYRPKRLEARGRCAARLAACFGDSLLIAGNIRRSVALVAASRTQACWATVLPSRRLVARRSGRRPPRSVTSIGALRPGALGRIRWQNRICAPSAVAVAPSRGAAMRGSTAVSAHRGRGATSGLKDGLPESLHPDQ